MINVVMLFEILLVCVMVCWSFVRCWSFACENSAYPDFSACEAEKSGQVNRC